MKAVFGIISLVVLTVTSTHSKELYQLDGYSQTYSLIANSFDVGKMTVLLEKQNDIWIRKSHIKVSGLAKLLKIKNIEEVSKFIINKNGSFHLKEYQVQEFGKKDKSSGKTISFKLRGRRKRNNQTKWCQRYYP